MKKILLLSALITVIGSATAQAQIYYPGIGAPPPPAYYMAPPPPAYVTVAPYYYYGPPYSPYYYGRHHYYNWHYWQGARHR